MSIINTHKQGATLEVKVARALNLWTKNMIQSRLTDEITNIRMDLSDCQFVDSEGVIFMYQWQQAGNTMELINPPDIFDEILDILELREHWDVTITETD